MWPSTSSRVATTDVAGVPGAGSAGRELPSGRLLWVRLGLVLVVRIALVRWVLERRAILLDLLTVIRFVPAWNCGIRHTEAVPRLPTRQASGEPLGARNGTGCWWCSPMGRVHRRGTAHIVQARRAVRAHDHVRTCG